MQSLYHISFDVETSLEDNDEIRALVWTLLKIGKQACGENPMTVPALKEINIEAGFCEEPYQPFRLFLLPSYDSVVKENTVPVCCATRFRELYDAISEYIERDEVIIVFYVPKGAKLRDSGSVYSYSSRYGVYKNYDFFEKYPELD